MNRFRRLYTWTLGVALFIGSVPGLAADEAITDAEKPPQQILVMLHLPPPHFRPDSSYGGGYGNDNGRQARHRIAAHLAQSHGLKLVDNWPMSTIGVDCFVMEGKNSASAIRIAESLSQDMQVVWAQPMNAFRSLAHNDPLYRLQPGADAWHLAELHTVATGRRVRIAVIDSEVEDDHPDLAGQVVFKENFVDSKPDTPEAHGTAVAGIIAARAGNGIGIEGVAPDARLMSLRACWQESENVSQCNSFTLGKALNAAINHSAQVINLSVTGPSDLLLHRLLDAALVRDIKVVGAMDPLSADGGFPASHPGVLPVTDNPSISATSSSIAARVLIAPGRDVPTTLPGARWGLVSGSSFAAAHVSGLVTLLTELQPSIKLTQLREAMMISSAVHRTPETIDACAAVMRVTGLHSCSGASAHATPAIHTH